MQPGARIYEIRRPADWNHLVEMYPHRATQAHAGWELPGPNQYPSDTRALRRLNGQRAVRVEPVAHQLPDWTAISADYDGVHLSWAGFLTTEGTVSELPNGAVTMLRYWGSERTLWLRDVFGEPRSLSQIAHNGWASDDSGRSEILDTRSAAVRVSQILGRTAPIDGRRSAHGV